MIWVRAQVDQRIHTLTCFHKWSIMSLWSRCMWVEYRLRKWRDKYGICVLERETKSCVAVYAEMPGVNKNPPTGHQNQTQSGYTLPVHYRWRGSLPSFSLLSRHVSLSLSLSHALIISPVACLHSWVLIFISSLIFLYYALFQLDGSVPLFHGKVASIDWIRQEWTSVVCLCVHVSLYLNTPIC